MKQEHATLSEVHINTHLVNCSETTNLRNKFASNYSKLLRTFGISNFFIIINLYVHYKSFSLYKLDFVYVCVSVSLLFKARCPLADGAI